jgi:hypothetical protein
MTRLLTKDGICAYLGEISAATYDNWHQRGIVPGPVPGTTRYDIRAHDAALDKIAGLDKAAEKPKLSPFEEWEQSHAA